MKEINTLEGQKVKNTSTKPKNRICAPKSVWSCDIPIVRKFYLKQEKYTFGGQKGKNKPPEPKNEIWAFESLFMPF
jgi:hypothetical protein